NLSPAVTDGDGPGVELLLRHITPDLGRAGFEKLRRGFDVYLLAVLTGRQFNVYGQRLSHEQIDVVEHGGLKAVGFDRDLVFARWQIRHAVDSRIGRGGLGLDI